MATDAENLDRDSRRAAPYGVLAVSLLVTLVVCFYIATTTRQAQQEQFENLVMQSRSAIDARLQTYIATLRAGAALFTASDHVTRAEFQRFADSLDLQTLYPGIQGIGYTVRVPAGEVEQFTATVRASGLSDFQIWPPDPRSEYHAILYLEPLDRRNAAAIGYDMFTEPARRAAMERARDTGQPAASGRVTLVQEIDLQKQSGFLIYVPLYKGGQTPESVEERRAALTGYIYAPFRTGDLFRGIFGSLGDGGVGFRIYDSNQHTPEHLLHDATRNGHSPRLKAVQPFVAAGQHWSIEFFSRPELEGQAPWALVPMAGISGLILSFVLFGLMRAQEQARLAAERNATELRASEAALRRSEARFRRLFDADLVGVAFATTDGRVLDANSACLRLTGHTREQVLAGKIRWDQLTPPEYAAADQEALRQVMETGACTPYEKEVITADGGRVTVLLGIARLEQGSSEILTLVVDLTQRKRYEEAMREARDAAEATSRLKDEFLATVSHELRTPLNAILGWTQLLAQNPQLASEARHGLETIERNARNQAQLIEDLLDVSRIISGQLRLSAQPTEVPPLIKTTLEAVQPAAQARGVNLVHHVDPDLPRVLVDPMRLQQIIWNLLHNAIKFTAHGGTVTVTVSAAERQLTISVGDTGAGIDPAFLPYVFERFRQADASSTRRHGGLGLGLSIVRHLVEAHGGSVTADSPGPGHGSTFRVVLPALDPATGTAHPTNGSPGNGCDVSLQGIQALVVDDDPDARDLMVRILASRGAMVAAAESVDSALRQIDAGTFNVLLADISMPTEDGYSLIARVRAHAESRVQTLPALAVTAQARPQDRDRALAAGFQLHISKPIQSEDLCRAVADLVASRPAH